MSAPHFFAADVSGDRVTLGRDDSRHALRVLRIRPGERITISDGSGSVVEATVDADAGDRLIACVVARRDEPAPRPALHVVQAIPKKGKLDVVVQKLTELGVSSIAPFASERSIPRWDASKGEAHAARLREVARQAAMQSRRAWLPGVSPPIALASLTFDRPAFVLHETAKTRLTAALPDEAPDSLTIVVGPEGGLTDDEVTTFRDRGAEPVTLGRAILRTETASLAAAAIALARYDLLG